MLPIKEIVEQYEEARTHMEMSLEKIIQTNEETLKKVQKLVDNFMKESEQRRVEMEDIFEKRRAIIEGLTPLNKPEAGQGLSANGDY